MNSSASTMNGWKPSLTCAATWKTATKGQPPYPRGNRRPEDAKVDSPLEDAATEGYLAPEAPAPASESDTDASPSDGENTPDASGDTAEPAPKPEPASPEIPEIFMGEEKALFNTAPIEKAGEEFLTEEELAADDREPNPFDSLFRAVGLVKEKLSLLRRNRRHPEESESEDEEWMEDSEQDETFPPAQCDGPVPGQGYFPGAQRLFRFYIANPKASHAIRQAGNRTRDAAGYPQ